MYHAYLPKQSHTARKQENYGHPNDSISENGNSTQSSSYKELGKPFAGNDKRKVQSPKKISSTLSCGCSQNYLVKIHYPFHPQYGKYICTLHSKKHHGEQHFIIEQPDGTYALLPAWMTNKSSHFQLSKDIVISLSAIHELQMLIKDYHKTSGLTKSPGDKNEINLSNGSLSGAKHSQGKTSGGNEVKNNRVVKAHHNRSVAAKK